MRESSKIQSLLELFSRNRAVVLCLPKMKGQAVMLSCVERSYSFIFTKSIQTIYFLFWSKKLTSGHGELRKSPGCKKLLYSVFLWSLFDHYFASYSDIVDVFSRFRPFVLRIITQKAFISIKRLWNKIWWVTAKTRISSRSWTKKWTWIWPGTTYLYICLSSMHRSIKVKIRWKHIYGNSTAIIL